jgi:hypothetical protein
MKRTLSAALLAASLSAAPAFSQQSMTEPTPRFGVGVAAVGALPVGDLADWAGMGFGGLAGVEVGTYPGLAVTARSGYVQHLEKEDNTVSYIPIMGGAKISTGAVYLAGEIGAVMIKQEYSGDNPFEDDVDETNLGWSAGVGSNAGPMDVRLSFNVLDAGHMDESMTVSLSLGFTAFSW